MISRFKYINWKQNQPGNIIEYFFTPAYNGTRILNFIFQKIFRINAEVPFMVHYTSQVSKTIYLGKGVAKSLANSGNCYLQGINKIYLGDHTIIAPGVKIISANHDLDDYSSHKKNIEPVKIGDNCWLGANCVILPGVNLGNNVVVGAGSVVTKSFGSNLIIAGNPAKIINRDDK